MSINVTHFQLQGPDLNMTTILNRNGDSQSPHIRVGNEPDLSLFAYLFLHSDHVLLRSSQLGQLLMPDLILEP